jgi:hypothetical protein
MDFITFAVGLKSHYFKDKDFFLQPLQAVQCGLVYQMR